MGAAHLLKMRAPDSKVVDPRHDSITFDKTLFANTHVLAHAQEVVLFSQHETTIAYDAPKGQPRHQSTISWC